MLQSCREVLVKSVARVSATLLRRNVKHSVAGRSWATKITKTVSILILFGPFMSLSTFWL